MSEVRADQRAVARRTVVGFLAVSTLWGFVCAAASSNANKAKPSICIQIANEVGRRPDLPRPLYVDAVEGEGRELIYLGVDVDGDGLSDNVKRDCGSPSEGTCSLYVTLSSGGQYEFNERTFSLIRFLSKYYLLVGHSSSEKSINRQLYAVTARGVSRICKKF